MTRTPALIDSRHRAVVIGTGAIGRNARTALSAAGVTDVVILPGREVTRAVFDDDTGAWRLTTAGDGILQARVVVAACRPLQVPWIPDILGRKDFGGESFHAAAWDPGFDPSGKHIAVIGADAAAGYYIERLIAAAATVTVFAHSPRRVVTELPLLATRTKRWLYRHTRRTAERPSAAVARSPIEAVTAAGIRTSDGVEHRVDAIIYGTGFTIPDRNSDETLVGTGGLTLRQVWHDGMEPYLGIAVHGFPNYFFLSGPDVRAQTGYVVECVQLMDRTASTRIEARRSGQQVFNERAHLKPVQPQRLLSAFDLSSSAAADDETYDGAATLTLAGTDHRVRVRLTGHVDPIDGLYHWQGTVFPTLPEDAVKQGQAATLAMGECSAPARIVERTPWGTYSIAGLGAPPYAVWSR